MEVGCLMCDFYNEHIVKNPQKVHVCEGCGKKMRTDRKHWYISGKFEGDFFASRICYGCKKHLDKYSSDYAYDGWCEGDLRDGRREVIKDWQYKRLNKAKVGGAA